MTSDSILEDRRQRRTAQFVYGCWGLMVVLAAVWIARYAVNSPLVDEWEFVPALFDEEPTIPWLWKQHNEHRFLVPRILYYGLFQLTHDFRSGCYVSLAGMAVLALVMIRSARQLRGRLHYADAFFPITLLHLGHFENFRMGYQICFMLIALFAGLMLAVIVQLSWANLARRGLQIGLLLIPLLGCGAGGLAFGPPVALGLLGIMVWVLLRNKAESRWQRVQMAALLLCLVAFVPLFISWYYRGYVAPEFHPPSAGLIPSLRIALQSLTMAFGVAVTGLWPVSAFLVGIVGFESGLHLFRVIVRQAAERPRAIGIFLYLGAIAAMAFGIGWGRSGFGESANMGFAPRYSWIIWPGLAAIYFLWLLYGGAILAKWVPIALFWVAVALLPFNMGTGIMDGENYREAAKKWQEAVQHGATDDELIERFHENDYFHVQERIRLALKIMRSHAFGYYFPLREPTPRELPPARPKRQGQSR